MFNHLTMGDGDGDGGGRWLNVTSLGPPNLQNTLLSVTGFLREHTPHGVCSGNKTEDGCFYSCRDKGSNKRRQAVLQRGAIKLDTENN